jgi:hypothetical protein
MAVATLYPSYDTRNFVDSSNPSDVMPNGLGDESNLTTCSIGYHSFGKGSGTTGYMAYFNVSSLAGKTVTAVTLQLVVSSGGGLDAAEVPYCRRVLSAWTESTTDGNYRATSTPSVATGAAAPYTSNPTFTGADMVTLVQGWISGTYTNYGLSVHPLDAAESGETLVITTSEHGSPPSMTVTYRDDTFQMII